MTPKDARTPAAYKVRPNALVSTDDSQMYAEFAASVPEVDREDEVIEPMDFVTEYWESNPVWLWAHDKAQLPIGAGYRPDGSVACRKTKDALILGCRFSRANPQGTLTYALYKENTLKMVSVGFIAGGANKVNGSPWGVPRPVTKILSPELVECSCVPIGMNRSAMLLSIKSWDGCVDRVGLASVLDNGHLHGEKVPEWMARDLAPFAQPKMFKAVAWNVKAVSFDKIPKFSSPPSGKSLALHQPFGSPFMATIAKTPLKSGVVPTEPTPVVVETKAVETPKVEEKIAPVVETKADDNASQPTEKPQLSVGAQIYKAMMESISGMCKGAMEMMPQSDSPDVQKYVTTMCGKAANMVGEMFEEASKAFPDFVADFEEPATLAQAYALIDDEPDAADAGPGQEEDLLEDVEKGDTDDEEDKPKDDDEKAVSDDVVTVKLFDEWHAKAFGERTPLEAFEEVVKPLVAEIAAMKAQLAEHQEALETTESILTGAR